MLNETQKFLLKFFVILILASFLTFSGVILSFYITLSCYLSPSIVHEHLQSFVVISFSMISIFDLSISFIFYQLLKRYNIHKNNTIRLIEIFLEIISHKFGNFLAGVKINLSLVNSNNKNIILSPKIYNRILNSVDYMDNELSNILSELNSIRLYNNILIKSNLSFNKLLSNQIEKSENLFKDKKNYQIILKNNCDKLENLEYAFAIELLLENALKYANSIIKIRTGLWRKKYHYLFILNDISTKNYKGLGLGLSIVDSIAKQNDFYVQWRKEGNFFKVLIYKLN